MPVRRSMSVKHYPILRFTQYSEGEDTYRVEISFEDEDQPRQTATAKFLFTLNDQVQENLRWYLEDYLQHPFDPAPTIAAGIEQQMAEIGKDLFRSLFHSNDDVRDIWARLRDCLNDTRVEVIHDVQGAILPWELLRDPRTDTPLALRAHSFVRAHPNATQRPRIPQKPGPIRILLVISRPNSRDDVPYRSISSRLVKGLSDRNDFQLDVLRPPTFEQLSGVLRQAKAANQPYHVVHFDGHGIYGYSQQLRSRINPLLFSDHRPGQHGYLAFENDQMDNNIELIDGPRLGKLLVETSVPVLILNACRSAHLQPLPTPDSIDASIKNENNLHSEVRAFGSLAQEIMDAGVAGVVAMRYNVYVVTAMQFVSNLYSSLAQGQTLGAAVTFSRKQLHSKPWRNITLFPIELQDWPVPIVYEAVPIALFSKLANPKKIKINLQGANTLVIRGMIDPDLPHRPDLGFFGQDATLLDLDRTFDHQNIFLLHGLAGSGKTTTAIEFARDYLLTGGADAILYTSFETCSNLSHAFDAIERMFNKELEQQGIQWQALSTTDKQAITVQILRQKSILWIWDSVEQVSGFSANKAPLWHVAEQKKLVLFLKMVTETDAKFLLTSRSAEHELLNNLPKRILLPPISGQGGIELMQALSKKHGQHFSTLNNWQPLFLFSVGNPQTLVEVVSHAMSKGMKTREQIEDFTGKLRRGDVMLDSQPRSDRQWSILSSLHYGFDSSFSEDEQKLISLLHLFQDHVDVAVLQTMGLSETDWCLPTLQNVNRDSWIALLDRVAEVGLLANVGRGLYFTHPALPTFLRPLFDQHYSGTSRQKIQVVRAFVGAVQDLGSHLHREYEHGDHNVTRRISVEESNLLYARELARANQWWDRLIGSMQGLYTLYIHTGRRREWQRLVEEVLSEFVDPLTEGPLPGRENGWSFITEYRVNLAVAERDLSKAEQLQHLWVEWERQQASPSLAVPANTLSTVQKASIRSYATALHQLGQIRREQGESDCIDYYKEAFRLSKKIDDHYGMAITAFNTGHAYKDIPSLRNLGYAENWYRRSLNLYNEHDRLRRGGCFTQLGLVAQARLEEAVIAERSEKEVAHHFNTAIQFLNQALELMPLDAVTELGTIHHDLGAIYKLVNDFDKAWFHCREAIHYREQAGQVYEAARTRFNAAHIFADAGRFEEALLYAQIALRTFESLGKNALTEQQKAQGLIIAIISVINFAQRFSPIA